MNLIWLGQQTATPFELLRTLHDIGYKVEIANTTIDAVFMLGKSTYDVLVIDLPLADMSASDFVTAIRRHGVMIPILFLLPKRPKPTDESPSWDADAYLFKPVTTQQLIKEVQSLQASHQCKRSYYVHQKGLFMDGSKHMVIRQGIRIQLSAREFKLLELFIRHQGRMVTAQSICRHLRIQNDKEDSQKIQSMIYRLRRKLEEGFDQPLIKTIWGVGYRFENRDVLIDSTENQYQVDHGTLQVGNYLKTERLVNG